MKNRLERDRRKDEDYFSSQAGDFRERERPEVVGALFTALLPLGGTSPLFAYPASGRALAGVCLERKSGIGQGDYRLERLTGDSLCCCKGRIRRRRTCLYPLLLLVLSAGRRLADIFWSFLSWFFVVLIIYPSFFVCQGFLTA